MGPAAPNRGCEAHRLVDTLAQLDLLMRRISADVADPDWAPAPADLDELRDLLDQRWREWRRRHGRRAPAPG